MISYDRSGFNVLLNKIENLGKKPEVDNGEGRIELRDNMIIVSLKPMDTWIVYICKYSPGRPCGDYRTWDYGEMVRGKRVLEEYGYDPSNIGMLKWCYIYVYSYHARDVFHKVTGSEERYDPSKLTRDIAIDYLLS